MGLGALPLPSALCPLPSALYPLPPSHQLSDIRSVHFADVDRVVRIDGDGRRVLQPLDALEDFAVFRIDDEQKAGLGAIDDVELVAFDEHAPRRAEVRPLRQELPFLIEHLHALVAAIADIEAAIRIDRDAVRLVELSRL